MLQISMRPRSVIGGAFRFGVGSRKPDPTAEPPMTTATTTARYSAISAARERSSPLPSTYTTQRDTTREADADGCRRTARLRVPPF